MRRGLGKACIGVLVLAVAGCTLDSFLHRQVVVYGPKVVVPGTVAEVSAKLRAGLSEAGLLLRTNRVGSDYRIVSQWKSGTVFCLHLKQMKDEDGIRTRVRMQWDRGGDAELWQLVLKILNAPSSDDITTDQQSEPSDAPNDRAERSPQTTVNPFRNLSRSDSAEAAE